MSEQSDQSQELSQDGQNGYFSPEQIENTYQSTVQQQAQQQEKQPKKKKSLSEAKEKQILTQVNGKGGMKLSKYLQLALAMWVVEKVRVYQTPSGKDIYDMANRIIAKLVGEHIEAQRTWEYKFIIRFNLQDRLEPDYNYKMMDQQHNQNYNKKLAEPLNLTNYANINEQLIFDLSQPLQYDYRSIIFSLGNRHCSFRYKYANSKQRYKKIMSGCSELWGLLKIQLTQEELENQKYQAEYDRLQECKIAVEKAQKNLEKWQNSLRIAENRLNKSKSKQKQKAQGKTQDVDQITGKKEQNKSKLVTVPGKGLGYRQVQRLYGADAQNESNHETDSESELNEDDPPQISGKRKQSNKQQKDSSLKGSANKRQKTQNGTYKLYKISQNNVDIGDFSKHILKDIPNQND